MDPNGDDERVAQEESTGREVTSEERSDRDAEDIILSRMSVAELLVELESLSASIGF